MSVFLKGQQVEIVFKSSKEYQQSTLEGELGHTREPLLEIFHGIIKSMPELADDSTSEWHFTDVVAFDAETGAIGRCTDMTLGEQDMGFTLSRLAEETVEGQMSLEIDAAGKLQL